MKILFYWKPIIIALLILYASITPTDNISNVNLFNIKHLDKLIHFLMYFIFSLTLYASIEKHKFLKKIVKIITILVITIFYGLLMESFQYIFTTYRSPEFFDALANTLGSVVGILLFPALQKSRLYKYL
ncbi:MAG: VanZ family protein [Bacteroidetes bacterium]|nr:VanZ family protein [Bacteroidota bacterium]